MRDKRMKVLYILFFIASVFFAAFVLAEFREDYLAIALAAIVMLIAAYFLVEKIERDIYEKYEFERNDINGKLEEATNEVRKSNLKIEQLQKAIYNASLDGFRKPDTKLQQLTQDLEEVEETLKKKESLLDTKDSLANKQELHEILQTQKDTIDLLKTGFKSLIQYSKENARQVALNTNEKTDELLRNLETAIINLKQEIPKINEDSLSEVKNQFESISESYLENTSLISQRLIEIQELADTISRSIQE